jgi:uncharacterized membrane protein (UPF0127 family)
MVQIANALNTSTMKYPHAFCCFLLGWVILSSCTDNPKKVIKTTEVAFEKEGELTLFASQTDSIIASLDIEIADNDYETETGLMYRKSMDDDHGMLFVFPDQTIHSFYMKNTEFPLDIVFIKNDMKIASFQENAQPLSESSLSSKVPVQYVLELNAGLVKEWGLKVGDSISYLKK